MLTELMNESITADLFTALDMVIMEQMTAALA